MNGKRTLNRFGQIGMAATPVLLGLLIGKEAGLFGQGNEAAPRDEADEFARSSASSVPITHSITLPPVTFGPADAVAAMTNRPAATPLAVTVSPDFAKAALVSPAKSAEAELATGQLRSDQVQQDASIDADASATMPTSPEIQPTQNGNAPEIAISAPETAAPVLAEPVVAAAEPAPQLVVPVLADTDAPATPEQSPAPLAATTTSVVATSVAAATNPAPATVAEPATKLAIADWNYRLPAQSSVAGMNSFAGSSVGSSPIQQPRAQRMRNGANAGLAVPAARAKTSRAGRSSLSAGHLGQANYRLIGGTIEFQMPVVASGDSVGNLTIHVSPDQELSLQLKELVSLFADKIDPQMLAAIEASRNIEEFVSFDRLRETGIDVRYDAARERLTLSVEQP